MSKQTRKKSSKTGSTKATATTPKPAAKRPPGKSTAKVAGKKVAGKLTKTPAKPSHRPASKTLTKAAVTKAAAKPVAKPVAPVAKFATGGSAKTSKPRVEKPAKLSARPAALAEGAKAPAFALPRDGGETVTLADFSGKKLAIFFYPRADTPGCTREAIDFSRLAAEFAACETRVVGVSADPLKAQESFRDKHQLATPLLSDEQHKMLEAYGAWGEKSMYGRTFQGVLRTTVLVGADGRIARIWRGVKVDGHADDVLAVAQSL